MFFKLLARDILPHIDENSASKSISIQPIGCFKPINFKLGGRI